MAPQSHTPGIARACAECHKRKIRCDVQGNGQTCSNCKLYGTPCQLRARKRRKANPSASKPTLEGSKGTGEPSNRQSEQKSDISDADSPSPQVTNGEQYNGVADPNDHQASSAVAYLDFSDYYGHHTYLKSGSDRRPTSKPDTLSESDKTILSIHRAFDLPPEPLKTSLIDSFMKHCFPWVPIFDRRWLWNGKEDGSPALTQAVLVAGARTSDTALSCQEYYSAAKYLLLCGHETNPILIIVACLLLGWWNQTAPDIVSLDNSTSWIRQAVGVAYQIDLHKEPRTAKGASYRRRLWWTLVARDSQLSASHGRPRYINLAICHVRPLSLADLQDDSYDSNVFVAYVKASLLLGDIAESCQQGTVSPARFAELRNALFWWLKELPSSLHCLEPGVQPTEQNFNMRQVYMLYLSTVAILHRSNRNTKTPSAVELIASSFIVGLLDGFHARNELRRLSAGFNFYHIVAGIPQLEALQFRPLQEFINREMDIIQRSFRDLGQRWPSAHRGLKLLEKVRNTSSTAEAISNPQCPTQPDVSDLLLFENFDFTKCYVWRAITESQGDLCLQQPPVDGMQKRQNIPYVAIPSNGNEYDASSASNAEYGPTNATTYDDIGIWFPDVSFDSDLLGGWLLNDDTFDSNLTF